MRTATVLFTLALPLAASRTCGAEDCSTVKSEVDLRPEQDHAVLALTVVAPEGTGWKAGTPYALAGAAFKFQGQFQTGQVLAGDMTLTAKERLDAGTTAGVDLQDTLLKLSVGTCKDMEIRVTSNGVERRRPRSVTKSLEVGPTASEEEGDLPDDADAQGTAFRFRGSFEASDTFGSVDAHAHELSRPLALFLRAAVDTTTEGSGEFLDDNRVALSVEGWTFRLGQVLRVLKVGVEVEYARAFHSRDRTLDGTAKMDLRFPFLPAVNLFGQEAPFRAPPLSANLSYGYRDARQAQDTSTTTEVNGRVFKANLAYHAFLLDQYRLSLGYDYAHTDPRDEGPVTRNQRLYRAGIAYLPEGKSRFEVLASYEDGSSGPVLRDVRQFFLGIALKKLGWDGSAGRQ